MYRNRKQNSMIILSMLFILMIMTVAYAAFQSKVKVKGTTKITSLWDVKITNVTSGTATGKAENKVAPTWDGLTANMEVNLYEEGDAMEYDVTVTNNGTIDAVLSDVLLTPSNSNALIITYTGFTKGEKLYKKGQQGSSKIVHVKIEYNPEYTGGDTSGESTIEFEYQQGEGGNTPTPGQQYLLTYDYGTNGGTSSTAINQYADSGATITIGGTAVKAGWTFVGWNTNQNATTGLTSIVMNSNKTLYAIYRKEAVTLTANWNANGATLSSAASSTCTIPAVYNRDTQGTSCTLDAPTITRNGYEIIGFNETADSKTNHMNYNVSTGKLTVELSKNNEIWYAITKNNTAFVANFNANGATLSSTEAKSCYIYNTETSCVVSTPTITAPSATPTTIGFSTSADNHTSNSAYNAGKKELTLTNSLNNNTWYAQTRKAAVSRTIRFYRNNNTSFTYNGTRTTGTSRLITACTIAATYNGVTQPTSCIVESITMPTIEAPAATPTVIGWSTGSSVRTATYTSGQEITNLELTANKTYYAQSTAPAQNLIADFNANGATLSSAARKTCTISATYNGTAQAGSCTVDAPTITRAGFEIIGFNTTVDATENHSAYSSSTGKITLTSSLNNNTWYAITKNNTAFTASWNANGATLSSVETKSCYVYNAQETCEVDAPTITRSGYTVVGYNTSASSTTNNTNYNATTGKLAISASGTWYAITHSNTGFTASFNGNGATLSSDAAQTCYPYNNDTSCEVDAPTIIRNGFTITGYDTSASSTTNNTNYNVTTGKLTISANSTWHAITNKEVTISWNANGATLSSSDNQTCNIYNTSTTCEVDAPTITRNGYTVIGYNTSASSTTNNENYNTSTGKLTVETSGTWHAITNKVVTVTFTPGSNTTSVGESSGTCTLYGIDISCTVTAPTITSNSGYLSVGWNTTSGETTGILPGENIIVTDDTTYYGNSADGTPIFTEDVEGSVVITYPLGCSSPYSCSYNIDGGTEVTVNTDSTTVLVGKDTVFIATATDGSNNASSTYTAVRSNLYVKTDGSDVAGTGYGTIAQPYATITKAYNSATSTRQATIYVMDDITHSDSTDMSSSKDIVITSCTRESSTSCPYSVTNTVTRDSNLIDTMIEAQAGTLTLTKITIDGDEVETQDPMILSTSSNNAQINLNTGSTVKNGKNTSTLVEDSGGGIKITGDADLVMNGGIVESNNAAWGAGLYLRDNSSLTINSGEVRNNTGDYGTGINSSAPITMSGGSITGNSGINGAGIVSSGTLTMTGGTVSGNTATGHGGGIYINENGIATISSGSISSNSAANGGGIASIGTLNMSGGSITKNTATTHGGGIFGTTESTINITGGTIGGSAANKNTATSNGGGIGTNGAITIGQASGKTTTISYNEAGAAGGGVLTGNYDTASLTVTGGTISNNTAGTLGGGLYASKGLNMTGGTISTNSATSGGGIASVGTFDMSGGSIIKNTVTSYGGGIYGTAASTITITGGTIGGSAANKNTAADHGGGITTFGAASIGQASGKTTTISYNESGASGGGICMGNNANANLTITGGTISNNKATDKGGGIYSIKAGTTVTLSGGSISANTAPVGGGLNLFGDLNMSGGTIIKNSATNGHGGGINSAGTITITNGTIGGSSTNKNTASTYGGGIVAQGVLKMSQASGKTTTVSYNTAGSYGGGVVIAGDTFTFSGGTVSNNTAATQGGGIVVTNNSASKLTLSGGTISNNNGGYGGGVYCYANGTIAMSSGTVSGNTSTSGAGGGISSAGTLTISGGTIIKNTSETAGGGIYSSGTITFSNGTIGGSTANKNTSKTYGGGIASAGPLNMSQASGKTTTISYNTSTTYGAGVVINGGTFTLSGGTISYNTATTSGGGVAVTNNSASKLTMTGGTITHNKGTIGGGIYSGASGTISMSNSATVSYNEATTGDGGGITTLGTLTMSGSSTVTNNTAKNGTENQYGGGVSCSGTCNLNAGTIKSNTANSGGGLLVANGTTTINGTSVESNTATSQSGGVHVSPNGAKLYIKSGYIRNNVCDSTNYGGGLKCNGTCNMSGGTISGNSVTGSGGRGGGVHIGEDGTFTLTGGSIINNSAPTNGGIHKTSNGVYNVSGSPSCSGNNQANLTTTCRLT